MNLRRILKYWVEPHLSFGMHWPQDQQTNEMMWFLSGPQDQQTNEMWFLSGPQDQQTNEMWLLSGI